MSAPGLRKIPDEVISKYIRDTMDDMFERFGSHGATNQDYAHIFQSYISAYVLNFSRLPDKDGQPRFNLKNAHELLYMAWARGEDNLTNMQAYDGTND